MRKKSKYQVGGQDDLYSTNFFNKVASYLTDNQQQQDEQESDDNPTEDAAETTSSDISDDNYQELLGKYNDLSSQLESLQRNQTIGQDFNDPFLNFIFQDDNNMPITFSNEEVNPTPSNFVSSGARSIAGSTPPIPSSSKSSGGFKQFNTPEEGRKALVHQLSLYQTGKTRNPVKPSSTLLQAMSVYSPKADNNDPVNYAKFIANKLGVTPDTPISQIDVNKWADAITQMEGNKGNNPGNLRRQFGGAGVASTPTELSNGLNGSALQSMTLDLPPQYNIIRGLDSGQPVKVTDQKGKTAVLHGPNHTTAMYGTVQEHKMQVGGYTKEQLAAANQQAKKFAIDKHLMMGQNATVGNRVPDYVDLQGNKLSPDYTTIPKPLVSTYIPQQVNEIFWDSQANLPYYIDPSSGDLKYTEKQNFYSTRFKKNP